MKIDTSNDTQTSAKNAAATFTSAGQVVNDATSCLILFILNSFVYIYFSNAAAAASFFCLFDSNFAVYAEISVLRILPSYSPQEIA